jgi:hypothetical protein
MSGYSWVSFDIGGTRILDINKKIFSLFVSNIIISNYLPVQITRSQLYPTDDVITDSE